MVEVDSQDWTWPLAYINPQKEDGDLVMLIGCVVVLIQRADYLRDIVMKIMILMMRETSQFQ